VRSQLDGFHMLSTTAESELSYLAPFSLSTVRDNMYIPRRNITNDVIYNPKDPISLIPTRIFLIKELYKPQIYSLYTSLDRL